MKKKGQFLEHFGMNYMGPEAQTGVLRVRYLRELTTEPSIPKQAAATSRRLFLMVRRQGLAKERTQNIEMRMRGSPPKILTFLAQTSLYAFVT